MQLTEPADEESAVPTEVEQRLAELPPVRASAVARGRRRVVVGPPVPDEELASSVVDEIIRDRLR